MSVLWDFSRDFVESMPLAKATELTYLLFKQFLMDNDTPPSSGTTCDCKVGSAISTYHLGDLNEELESEYEKRDASLRDLEQIVNEAITEAALAGDGPWPMASRVGLSDASVSDITDAVRGQDSVPKDKAAGIRTRLTQAEIDIDELRRHYVSYQTVRKHLNQCLAIDTSREETITISDASRTIGWAQSQCRGIIDRTLRRLRRVGDLSIGKFEVSVIVRVECTDCGHSMPVSELLQEGSCECES